MYRADLHAWRARSAEQFDRYVVVPSRARAVQHGADREGRCPVGDRELERGFAPIVGSAFSGRSIEEELALPVNVNIPARPSLHVLCLDPSREAVARATADRHAGLHVLDPVRFRAFIYFAPRTPVARSCTAFLTHHAVPVVAFVGRPALGTAGPDLKTRVLQRSAQPFRNAPRPAIPGIYEVLLSPRSPRAVLPLFAHGRNRLRVRGGDLFDGGVFGGLDLQGQE